MLVSLACHMRRINMIAGRVFSVADWVNAEWEKNIVSEYVKFGWILGHEALGNYIKSQNIGVIKT
ncbi:MAG: hypothetical protein JZU65_04165 [Chlorobium sp.]|nr:hypothetical protein [Chlorobium sp.]